MIVRAYRLLGSELARLRLGFMRIEKNFEALFPNEVWGGCHHMGTTRMSSSAATGVVDRNCRVHGMENLFIAGSSVFSTSGAANPTLTIVALSIRLAAHLSSKLSN
ncbi:MAG: GMC family oxidoreductase [Bdellovibrionota bacterium]|nr:MAG: GMC family oxidoreductase [Bdellovibrionota bacterium]